MPTRNVVVTPAQAAMIDELIERGRFQNASEVMRAGLRLVEEREAILKEISEGLKEGLEDIKHGRVHDGETAVHDAFAHAIKRRSK